MQVWGRGYRCHLGLEVVPEVAHEGVVLLSALIDAFDQVLGPLPQGLNARVQRGEVGGRLFLKCQQLAGATVGGHRRAGELPAGR